MSKLLNKNFSYSIEYYYSTQYSCDESGCDVICRCGIIYNEHINSVNFNDVVGEIYSEYFDNSLATKRDNSLNDLIFGISKEIDLYTIDRVLRHFKLWETQNWEMVVDGGYYGEEMNNIILENSVAKKIESCLDIAFSIDELSGRIEYLLGLEYGHVLTGLTGRKYEVIEINREDIIFGSDGHYEKVKCKKLDHYLDSNYNGIRGIVLFNAGDKWRLLDGYHRCISTKKDKVKVLKAYN